MTFPSARTCSILVALLLVGCDSSTPPATTPPVETAPQQETESARAARLEAAVSHLNVGVRELEQFAYKRAIAEFESALKLRPDWLPAQTDLAVAHLNNLLEPEHAAKAEAAARKALELAPAEARVKYVLAYTLSSQQRRFQEALPLLRDVVVAEPSDARAWYELGTAAQGAANEGEDVSRSELLEESEAAYRKALALAPMLGEANYKLARMLVDSDDEARVEEGMKLLEHHQVILKGRPAVQQNYLTRGDLALAYPFVPERPAVPEPRPVSFRPELLNPAPAAGAAHVCVADFNADGLVDIVMPSGAGPATASAWLWLGTAGGTFQGPGAIGPAGTDCLDSGAGDFDRDGSLDLAVGCASNVLLMGDGTGTFTPREGSSLAGSGILGVVDLDHDGDLDVLTGRISGQAGLQRNDGEAHFVESAAEFGLAEAVLAWGDLDGDNAVDGVLTSGRVWLNSQSAEFRSEEVAAEAGPWSQASLQDFDADGDLDLLVRKDRSLPDESLLLTPSGVDPQATGQNSLDVLYRNDSVPGELRFVLVAEFEDGATTTADLDLDGWPEFLERVGTTDASGGFQSAGRIETLGGADAGDPVRAPRRALGVDVLLAVDLDTDGDLDLLGVEGAAPRIHWNDLEGPTSWVSLGLRGREGRSNPQGLGAKLELVAGSLRQHVEVSARAASGSQSLMPSVFGLGARPRFDGVGITWPSGIGQAELGLEQGASHEIVEIDRQPSSCPMLYAWNGETFAFLTDCFDTAPVGLWVAPGTHVAGDPQEFYRLRDGVVKAVDGVLNFSVAEFLNESLLADQVKMMAVEHDAARTVVVDEGVRLASPAPEFVAWSLGKASAPSAARHEGRDCSDALRDVDLDVVGWEQARTFIGLAAPHAIEFDLDETAGLLVLSGSLNFPNSTSLYGAHQAGLRPEPPRLERLEGSEWRLLTQDCGLPAGFHKDVVVDLRAFGLEGSGTFRVTTNLQVSWDRVAFYQDVSAVASEDIVVIPHIRADKRWLGIPREVKGPGNRWRSFPRDGLSGASDWVEQAGPHTPSGDVRDLLAEVDGELVVLRPGEEMLLGFDEGGLPALGEGRARTHVLSFHGWVKDADPHTALSASVLPFPVPGKPLYP